jgi:hypothetical protein
MVDDAIPEWCGRNQPSFRIVHLDGDVAAGTVRSSLKLALEAQQLVLEVGVEGGSTRFRGSSRRA